MEKYMIKFHSMEQIQDFVHWSEQIPYDMDLLCGSVTIDGKSIAGIIALGIEKELCLAVYGQLSDENRLYIQQFTK